MKRILSSILVIAMLFTLLPVSFAADYDYEVKTGAASYTVNVGDTVEVPVYLVPKSGSVDVQMIQTQLNTPAGLTSTAVAGLVDQASITIDAATGDIIIFQDKLFTATATAPLATITYTAVEAGTYTIEVTGTELYDADYVDLEGTIGETGATIEATVKQDEPVVPPVVSNYDYEVKTGAASYTVNKGETVEVPVYLVPKSGSVDVQMIQTQLNTPAGLTSTAVAGLVDQASITIDAATGDIIIFQDKLFTATADAPLATITYTAVEAGTYTIEVTGTELYDADYVDLEGTIGETGATITVIGSVPPAPVVTLESIAVAPAAFEVPYGTEDVLAAVKAAITAVTATYSDATTAPVTDYAVELSADGAKAIVTYEGKTAEIALTYEAAPVVLADIAVDPSAFEVPYGTEDVLEAVKGAITAVTAKYSDGSTAAVTDYTVVLDGTNKAVVEFNGFKAEIALTYEAAPVVLTGITVAPAAFEVPYGADAKAAVEDAITAVTAVYSDGTTAAVTGYTVAIDGNKAIVTYEGKTAEIALTFEAAPIVPPVVGNYDYEVKTGEASYTVNVGETVEVPVYLVPKSGSVDVQMIQTQLNTPAGLTSTAVAGLVDQASITIDAATGDIIVFQDKLFTATADAPLLTITYTAVEAGTYTIEVTGTELYDADYVDLEGTIGETGATITVTGNVPPTPVVTLESITVNPTAFEVPYGADAQAAVEEAITGVTGLYSDGTTAAITGYEVTIDGDVATVTYEGKTATIALTFAEPPVTDVEIIVAVNSIVVPYNITVPVDVYAISQVGEVKVKDSKGDERVVEAQITYDADASVVTVAYAELAPVSIPVTVITLVDYTIGGITGVIEIPYDCTDAAAYVKGIITVTANLSDGSTMDIPYFTVEVNDDWSAAYVKVGDEQIEVVDTKKGEAPVAAITGIKVEVAEAIVVPYGTDDIAAYIKSKIVVKTVDEDGVENAISEYTVDAKDGYADITFGEFTESVDFTVETAQLVANVTAIEIPYTVAEADYAAYIAQNVALTIDYSANTADKAVVATAADVVIAEGVATITIEGLAVEVAFTVQAAPEYEDTAVAAYGLDGKVLVKITGVADGKVAVVNGLQATYFGNGKFAAVVDAEYTVELVEVAEMPAAAEFGKLHAAGVTAWDALVTNDEALEKEVEVFEDVQMYVIADLDGNGKIEAIDALNINKISLYQGAIAVPTWVDAE